jgi:adenosylcobinamide kinase/adenosylcobinamide-phosphate guanylyltransferase
MALLLLIGGARSGKSRLAVQLASEGGGPVRFIATGEAGDQEMADRIERHRAERPGGWRTVEEPLRLGEALAEAAADECVVVDCLTLWVANLIEHSAPEEIQAQAEVAAAAAAARTGATIVVTNEVGLGIVPMSELSRRYRDVLGRVNAIWANAAAECLFVAAGRALRLEDPGQLLSRFRA